MKASDLTPGDIVTTRTDSMNNGIPVVFIGRSIVTRTGGKNTVAVPEDVVLTDYADKLRAPGSPMRPNTIDGTTLSWLDDETMDVLCFVEIHGYRHQEIAWTDHILVAADGRKIDRAMDLDEDGWNSRYLKRMKWDSVERETGDLVRYTHLVTSQAEWGSQRGPIIPRNTIDPSKLLIGEPVRLVMFVDDRPMVVVQGVNTGDTFIVRASDLISDPISLLWNQVIAAEVTDRSGGLIETCKSRLGALHDDTTLFRGPKPEVDTDRVSLPWSLVLAILGGTDDGNAALEALAETAIAVTGAAIEVRSLPRLG